MPGQVQSGSRGNQFAASVHSKVPVLMQTLQHYPRAQHQVYIVVNIQALLQSVGVQPLTEGIVSVGAGQVAIRHPDIGPILGSSGCKI